LLFEIGKTASAVHVDVHYRDNMPSHFKFKEYCPVVFRNLRERFGIDEEVYLVSNIISNILYSFFIVFN